ncbi:Zn-dependent hydrolase [Anaerobacillus sp. MEB173]|uniref:Zn-dependent hydrolase n=1 Tax=Anaerobacillus sp. MEB173 TaxID=3383345 RepID=UPI003F8EB5BC
METTFSRERLLFEQSQCNEINHIDVQQFVNRLSKLAEIGKTETGGISRFPYTDEYEEVTNLFKSWIQTAGLEVREDAIGNIIAKYEGQNPDLPVVMTGSHLDTVPNGGAFDGVLGCLSSLTAIESYIKENKRPLRSIELVVFVDEEGSRFNHGLFGSRAIVGEVSEKDLAKYSDDAGISLIDAMKKQGYNPEDISSVYRNINDIHAFLELHIEQGKILEYENKDIGVVTGIVGLTRRTFTFYGSTDHAGSTPMNMRKDTVAAAAELISGVEKLPSNFSDTAVATVGKMNVYPNGTNVIAGKTEVTVDMRDISEDTIVKLEEAITELANKIARERSLELDIQSGDIISPVLMAEEIKQMIKDSSEQHQLSYREMPSGAGHDAMNMGRYVPTGMIFVPSHEGKSHSPREWTSLSDCLNGIQVLKETLYQLASR